MTDIAVEVRSISKRFGATQSLDQLSFTVHQGTILGLLGPNGAGKTTTIRAMLGLVRPDSGNISVLGRNPQEDSRTIRRNVGAVLEGDGLYSRLSAWDNLDFHCRIWGLTGAIRDERLRDLLSSFDLWERRRERVINWSKGMRQKLAVSRALLHQPRLLLLDEPFSGLDPVAAAELRGRIIDLARAQGVTVILTTHDLAHVEKSCNQVVVIQNGRAIADGAPDRLGAQKSWVDLVVVGEGLREDILTAIQQENILLSFELAGSEAHIRCCPENRQRVSHELTQRGVIIEEFKVRPTSLEDLFIELVDGTSRS